MADKEKSRLFLGQKRSVWLVLALFAGYWLFTLGMAFIPASMARIFARPSMAYRAFIKQDWRLFSSTAGYNRKVMFVFHDSAGQVSDTFQVWERIVELKKKTAPFNNSEDAVDHIFFQVVNGLEREVDSGKNRLYSVQPDLPDSVYVCRSSADLASDTLSHRFFRSILAYGRTVFLGTGRHLPEGKCELIVTRDFIPPLKPVARSWQAGQRQFMFKSFVKLQ
jgi:hypothetical protein